MHWELWDKERNAIVGTFVSEIEALRGIRKMLAERSPDYVDSLVLGAMYDEGAPRHTELPPVLEGAALRFRLAESGQSGSGDSAARAVHERIRLWLAEEDWYVEDVPDPPSSLNLMVTLQGGKVVNIFQRKDHVDHITVVQHWVFEDTLRSALAGLSTDVQHEILEGLYRDVMLAGVDLGGLSIPPHEMRYAAFVYFDGLTKDALVQRILLILRALALSIQTIARGIGQPPAAVSRGLRQIHRSEDILVGGGGSTGAG
jgi:hypothetical protein